MDSYPPIGLGQVTGSSVRSLRTGAAQVGYASSVNFAYSSIGDVNGMFYYFGTDYGNSAWTNPHTAGRLIILRSSDIVGTASDLINRAAVYTTSDTINNSWIGWEIGYRRAFLPTDYTFVHRPDDGSQVIRNWKIQGSNNVAANTIAGFNAGSWTDLDTHVSDTTMPASPGASARFVMTPPAIPYRFIRILNNGVNASGSLFYIQLDEIEFYGTLYGGL